MATLYFLVSFQGKIFKAYDVKENKQKQFTIMYYAIDNDLSLSTDMYATLAYKYVDIFITVFAFLSICCTLKLFEVFRLSSSKNCNVIWYTIFDNLLYCH